MFHLVSQKRNILVIQCVWYVPPFTFLAAVDLVVFHHEFFELTQQLHRLLPDRRSVSPHKQRPYPQSQVHNDSSCLFKSHIKNTELMIYISPTTFLPPGAGWWFPSPYWSLRLEIHLTGEIHPDNTVSVNIRKTKQFFWSALCCIQIELHENTRFVDSLLLMCGKVNFYNLKSKINFVIKTFSQETFIHVASSLTCQAGIKHN